MESSNGEMRGLLDQILKRLDDGVAVGNKRHEDQVTFNAQVSQDLNAVRRQIDLTQADVDEDRMAAATAAAPP